VTRIYRKGEIQTTRRSNYPPAANKARLGELMQNQHEYAVKILNKEMAPNVKQPADYIKEVKGLLKKKRFQAAHGSVKEAMEIYPDDLFLISFDGYLLAKVEKKNREGIEVCRKAIETLRTRIPFGAEFFYPVLYMNLGRAYLAADRKKEAVEAFNKGVSFDPENKELLWEMRKLGLRRKPVVPFIARSNPINKYIGKLRSLLGR
jgi:tetratricopeptide (TPR) repeat protein